MVRTKAELLSDNLILMLNELLNNQNLVKYLKYIDEYPLEHEDVNGKSLMLKSVYPTPFTLNSKVNNEGTCQLHVYYTYGSFDDMYVEDTLVNFDIVISNSLWLCRKKENKNGKLVEKSIVRPYEIMYEIMKTFVGNSVGTLGIMKFNKFNIVYVNEYIQAVRLAANVTTFAKG